LEGGLNASPPKINGYEMGGLPKYKHHRFPSEIIQYTVWLYYRLNLSYRDVEDLLAEHGIIAYTFYAFM
jgi:transposase-like protein